MFALGDPLLLAKSFSLYTPHPLSQYTPIMCFCQSTCLYIPCSLRMCLFLSRFELDLKIGNPCMLTIGRYFPFILDIGSSLYDNIRDRFRIVSLRCFLSFYILAFKTKKIFLANHNTPLKNLNPSSR